MNGELESLGFPSLQAERWILLKCGDEDEILASQGADIPCSVASLQKLLTALLVCKLGGEQEKVEVCESDYLGLPLERMPAYLGFKPKEIVSVEDLLHALLMVSANDAAMALARHFSDSPESFAREMTKLGKTLGMTDSFFVNPHGLPDERQYSTARDMAILGKAVLSQPRLRNIVKKKDFLIPRVGGTNFLLKNSNRWIDKLIGCNGLKTGFTKSAGYCLSISAMREDLQLVAVLLNSTAKQIWTDSFLLLEWGFNASLRNHC